MLTLLRDLLRTNVAKLLFGIIVIAMGAWGFSGAFSGIMGDSQIRVAGRKLDATHLGNRVEQHLQNISQETGETLTPQEAVEKGIVRQIYDYEVYKFAHLKYADQLGITSTDDKVIASIQEIEGFQDPSTGKYDSLIARQALANAGMRIEEFERDLRDDLTLETLINVLPSGLVAPAPLAEMEVAYLNEQRKFSILIVNAGITPAPEPPISDELEEFYYNNTQDFSHPERRLVDMLLFSPSDFTYKVELDEAELKAYYESVKYAQFAGPSKRKIFEATFSSEELATQALGRIASGSTLSDENVTTTTRTVLQTDIENERIANQIFAPNAGEGQIFGPVEIDKAWRVMRIEEIVLAEPSPYPDVKETIQNELMEQQALNLYFEAIGKIDDLIGAGLDLKAISKELGVPIFSLAPINEQGDVINGSAVNQLVSKEGLLEEIFSLRKDYLTEWQDENGQVLIVQVLDIFPANLPPFEDSEFFAMTVWNVRKFHERLDSATEEIRQKILSGDSTFEIEASLSDAVVLREFEEAYTRENIEEVLPVYVATDIFSGKEGDIFLSNAPGDATRMLIRIDSITKPKIDRFGIEMARASSRLKQEISNDIAIAMSGAVIEKTKFRPDRRAITQYESQVISTQ